MDKIFVVTFEGHYEHRVLANSRHEGARLMRNHLREWLKVNPQADPIAMGMGVRDVDAWADEWLIIEETEMGRVDVR